MTRLSLRKSSASLRRRSSLTSAIGMCALAFALLMPATAPANANNGAVANIVGRTLDGKLTSLRRSLGEGKTLINFWWVNCSPCKQELPDLIAKENKHPEVKFIYVHAETNAKTKAAYLPEVVQGFLDRMGISLNNVIIGTTKARMSAGVELLPTTLLVNAGGQIDRVLVGFTDENTAQIASWLAQ